MCNYLVLCVIIASFIPQVEVMSYTASLVSGEIIHFFDAPSSVHKNIVMRIANYYEYLYLMIRYCAHMYNTHRGVREL